jgi:proprotein convertase subtilisin/kexin type 5
LTSTECTSQYGWGNSSGNKCSDCHATCLKCTGPNDNQCLTCSQVTSYKYLYLTLVPNKYCLTTCYDVGHYADSSNICVICDIKCTKCTDSGSNNCNACISGYFLKSTSCLTATKCTDNFGYPDTNINICVNCHSTCLKCSGGVEEDKCTDCSDPRFFYQNKCIVDCHPYNHYNDKNNRKCIKCDNSCVLCDGPGEYGCDACNPNYYTYQKDTTTLGCLTSCRLVYRKQTETPMKLCFLCDKECSDCFGPNSNQCLQCYPNTFLYQSSCIMDCSLHKSYGDTDYNICRPCYGGCAACFGPEYYQCTKCIEGYYYLKRGNKEQCLLNCPTDGYFSVPYPDNSCQRCHVYCQRCFGHSYKECTSCGFSLALFETSCGCRSREYMDPSISCKRIFFYLNKSLFNLKKKTNIS